MKRMSPLPCPSSVLACGALVAAVWGCADPSPPCAVPVFDTQGHRGARAHRPENTLPAMEYALSKGVRTLEMDLAVTRDDQLVLSHDPFLTADRCRDGDGNPPDNVPIHSLSLAEVQRFDCGSTPHPDFPNQVAVPGTPPPTLLEVLAMAETRSGGTARYNIEPKMDPAWDGTITPSAETFMDLVEDVLASAGVADRVLIQSFDPRPLQVLSHRQSTLRRSLLVPATQLSIHGAWALQNPAGTAVLLGCQVLSPYGAATFAPLIAAAHDRGLKVIPWTVNDRATMTRLINAGVDGLISDDVDLLVEVVGKAHPSGGVCF